MVTIKSFRPFSPPSKFAKQVASLPYDVMNSAEARTMVGDNQNSFLRITKPEVDLPEDIDIHSKEVYQKGAQNLQDFIEKGILVQENEPVYYIYQQVMGGHIQTGLVGLASVDEYRQGIIKKHEFTRPVKVDDRVALMEALGAQTGPVFLAARQTAELKALYESLLVTGTKIYDFESYHGVRHILYRIFNPDDLQKIDNAFNNLPALYIADGHHRSESAAVYSERQSGDGPHKYFLTVTFPGSDLKILPYNRVVHDLNGNSVDGFLAKVSEKFDVTKLGAKFSGVQSALTYGMYLDGSWYLLKPKSGVVDENDPVKSLDVSVLQDNILGPILDIKDPRTSDRIDFVGGIRGDQELVRLVDGGHAVAFSVYPTSMDQVMDVADQGEVMPPKSTWFEPKLLSGLFTYSLK